MSTVILKDISIMAYNISYIVSIAWQVLHRHTCMRLCVRLCYSIVSFVVDNVAALYKPACNNVLQIFRYNVSIDKFIEIILVCLQRGARWRK